MANGDMTGRPSAPPLTEVILDSIVDGVFTVDQNLRIAYWNRGAEKITGFGADDAIGRPCCEVFRASLCGGVCPMKKAIDTGLPSGPTDVEIVSRDLEEIHVSVTAAALRDADGAFIGGVEAFRALDANGVRPAAQQSDISESVEGLLSRNPQMKRVLSIIPAVASSDAPMVICGRSGTGKKHIARAVHRLSARGSGPFVTISCPAVTEELRAAEREGRPLGDELDFAQAKARAEGGTLILHEIGDLSPVAQVSLLQLLQHHELAGSRDENGAEPSVRVVATTSQDLTRAVREGRFREDLFFRLAVVTIDVPSLAERREDIPLLAERLLERQGARIGKTGVGLSAEVTRLLEAHDYPGNVRELENILEHALIVCTRPLITTDDLPSYVARRPSAPGFSPQPTQPVHAEELTSEKVLAALHEHSWNKSHDAKSLGIHRSTLWRRMKRLGLDKKE